MGTRIRVFAAAFAMTAGVLGGVAATPAIAAEAPAVLAPQDSTVIDVTSANYDQVMAMSKTKPVVLDFYASWCGPCQKMAPYLEKYHSADAGKWIWAKVDVSNQGQNKDIADKYGIEYIPTLIDIASGQEKGSRVVGFDEGSGPKDLRTWLNKL
ncbi:thioredoxin family protein [Amycolatopsis sp. PS_44_ISF1]|uniref:thioredoxin family protein n=1 Tax=Amycolatopsis sp. PS_44_ISF1 TaxID=2974917 RepID=UPI0028DF09EE|nr:thioredoxin family protein [Amycolatopsis sp. PS_44_ISF1]MDT8914763.1 thioredoxin family protein [Amycolatopsis sp. PS_44_ISF1]